MSEIIAAMARRSVGLVVMSIFGFVTIIPFLYMLLISFKSPAEMGNGNFVPVALHEMFRLGDGTRRWVRFNVTAEQQSAVVAASENLRVITTSSLAMPRRAAVLDFQRQAGGYTQILVAVEPGVQSPLELGEAAGLVIPPQSRRAITADAASYDPAASAVDLIAQLIPSASSTTVTLHGGTILKPTFRDATTRLFANYRTLLNWASLSGGNMMNWLSGGFPRWFLNSLLVSVITVFLGIFFDSLAAYAFAKLRFPFRRYLFAGLLLTLMIPYPVTLVPTFFVMANLGLYNTYLALIIPGLVSAFGIFMVRQYMQTIPDEILDAARVDGAGDFKIYWNVVLPAARPVIAALAVFRFIWQWNTYLYPLVLTNKDSMKTLQLGLATLQDAYGNLDYGQQMAGASIAVVPVVAVYALLQRHFVSGITMGGVKH